MDINEMEDRIVGHIDNLTLIETSFQRRPPPQPSPFTDRKGTKALKRKAAKYRSQKRAKRLNHF